MSLKKRQEGKLSVEQARDVAGVRAMLDAAGMMTDGVESPSSCYLIAYFGHEPVGVVGIEPMLDAALMRSLYVVPAMRRRGVGAALIDAGRKAAHSRGVRSLYAVGDGAGEYLRRFGFSPVAVETLLSATSGMPGIAHYRERPEALRDDAFFLDISQDGIIAR